LVIVKVPVEEVTVKPLIVLFVSASEPARVANVPVVGSVTFVAPVVVNVKEFAPEVVNAAAVVSVPAISILPANLIVLAALTTSRVTVRPAVNVVEETAARVTSNAAEVSRIPRPVIPV